jgi:hypothetical protein
LKGVPVDKPRETSVDNPVKPRKHAAKSIKENPALDATCIASFAETCDNRKVNKNDPGSAANTVNPGSDHQEGVANLIVPKLPTWVTDETTAIHYLEFAHHGYQNALHTRTHAAYTARHYGVTNRVIGEIYGIAESTVRLMLKKAGDA